MKIDLQNPRARRWLTLVILASLLVFLAAGGALLFFTDAFAPAAPTVVFAPSPSLDELAVQYPEIGNVLRDPALGSAYKDFLVAYQQGGLAAAEKLASERGLLNSQRQVQLTLVLDSPSNAAAVTAELRQRGVIVEGTYDEFVDIAIPLPLIEQIAQSENPGAIFQRLGAIQHVIKIRMPTTPRGDARGSFSEGVNTTGAQAWHQAGFTGKGIKIGVLDQGFDGYKNQLGKSLPARVTAKSFVSGVEPDQTGETHGTACAEIVSAMAPSAELYLAYYNRGSNQRQAVDWLVNQGAQIISHSAGGFEAPMDGTGAQARLVDTIAAKNIVWVNSSANQADGHYRATIHPGANQWIGFPNNNSALRVTYAGQAKETQIVLRWDDWGGNAAQDLDLFFYDERGNLVARSADTQSGAPGDQPVEAFELTALSARAYLIKISAKRVTRPVVFDLYAYNGKFDYTTPGYSLATPADARGAFTVGAIDWRDNSLESFSSRGPTVDGRLKPELVAPDRVKTSQGTFAGTSAAAPHASGAAALVWSRFPQMSASDVKAYLQSNAVDMGARGADMDSGYGRLQLPAPSGTMPRAPAALPSATLVAVVPSRVPTTAPSPQAAPRPPDSQRSNTTTGIIAILGLLMCGGVVVAGGGVTMLVVFANKSRAATPAVVPSPSPRPAASYPAVPRPPITPRSGSLALVGLDGQRISVPVGVGVVGRASNCAIYLEQPQVSRQHARVSWDGARATVTDLGSTNGTFVNGRRLAPNVPEPVQSGDRVSFGGAALWQVLIG